MSDREVHVELIQALQEIDATTRVAEARVLSLARELRQGVDRDLSALPPKCPPEMVAAAHAAGERVVRAGVSLAGVTAVSVVRESQSLRSRIDALIQYQGS